MHRTDTMLPNVVPSLYLYRVVLSIWIICYM